MPFRLNFNLILLLHIKRMFQFCIKSMKIKRILTRILNYLHYGVQHMNYHLFL